MAAAAVSLKFASCDISRRSLFLWCVTGHPSTLKLWEQQSFLCHGRAAGWTLGPCAGWELMGLGLEWGFHLCRNSLTSPSLAAAWVV